MSWHSHRAHRQEPLRSAGEPASGHRHAAVPRTVEDVLASPGRPLDTTTRSLLERQFDRNLRREPPTSSIGDRSGGGSEERYEQEARRLGGRALATRSTSTESVPPSRSDFSGVRVHTDPKANASARAVSARAYTAGRHVVFGSGEYAPGDRAGRQLLAHELVHVEQQGRAPAAEAVATPIQRVGLFESIARFFGGGTFSDEELTIYIDALEGRNRIEDDVDSDNKAREVVRRGLHRAQPLNVRVLLIREMLSGFTGDDDEQAILTILEDAAPTDQERIVEGITAEGILDGFQGEERDRLYRILGQVSRNRRQDIASSWSFSFSERGAEGLRREAPVTVEDLTVQPGGSTDMIHVAGGVTNGTGSPASLNANLSHPRDVGGTGYISVRAPAGRPAAASAPIRQTAPYGAVTRDRHDVTASLDITYRAEKVGDVVRTTEQQSGTQRQAGTGTRRTTTDGTSRTAGAGATESAQVKLEGSRDRGLERSDRVDKTASRTTDTTVTLSGELTPEIRGSVSLGGDFQIGGELLSSLLLLAGPEGVALYGLLNGLDVLDSTQFKLTGKGELGFSLQLRLSAQVARRWSETRSRVESAGTTASVRVGERAQVGRDSSASVQASATASQQSADETSSSESRTGSTLSRAATTSTDLTLVPVIDQAQLRFHVH